jgi:hypothetical protein
MYARTLAEAMPPICRAVDGGPNHSTDLIDAFLTGIADAAVRTTVDGPIQNDAGNATREGLAALTGPPSEAVFASFDSDVAALADPLDTWFDELRAATGPVRVLFRLSEPADGDEQWWVDFALQSTADQSLVIDADQVWSGATVGGAHVDEEFLAGLGRASRLCPEIETSLGQMHPAGLTFDTEGAYRFLKQDAPLLRAAGFGVQLPRWAGTSKLGVRLTTRSGSPSDPVGATTASGFSMDDLVRFHAELALGDEVVSADDLAELARLKVPLVRVRGQWVELDDRQLAAALKFMENPRDGEMTGREVLHEVLHGDGDLPIVGVDADGALGEGREEGGVDRDGCVLGDVLLRDDVDV